MRIHSHCRSILACALAGIVAGCGDSDVRADGAPAAAAGPTPGYATGKITMPDGKPIPVPYEEITFSINGTALHGENASFTPIVNPDGTYKQKLSAGSFKFSAYSFATIKLPYEGKKYTLQIEPVGPNWKRNRESADGIVQDYVWKPTGEHPLSDGRIDNFTNWYGGSVGVRMGTWRQDVNKVPGKVPDGATCVFTLKPTVAKTIDGQPAKTLVIERKFSEQWTNCPNLNDLPIAHYELTGEVQMPDGTKKPMLWHVTYGKYLPAMPIRFEPDETMRSVISINAEWLTE